jgi:hypothetical protein
MSPSTSRNPFLGETFFLVPLKLYEGGFARLMGKAEFKRYVTLMRIANYRYGEKVMQIDLESLRELDGVAPRTARQVHTKLQERGLIHIVKTKPFTYELIPPSLWEDRGPCKPRMNLYRRIKARRQWNP